MGLDKMITEIKNEKMIVNLLKSGDIKNIKYDGTKLNLYDGNILDGSLYKIYLKVGDEYTSLFGLNSNSNFSVNDNQIFYLGQFKNIDYEVIFTFLNDMWFVDVNLKDTQNKSVILFYCFDVGLCGDNVNELYNCQYIDHSVIQKNNIYTILSKQNQGRPLLLETSSLNEMEGYCTDGFQFYGLEYKQTNIPKAIIEEKLPSENYQYEFAYACLKTKKINLDSNFKNFTFYHKVTDNYNIFPPKPNDLEIIKGIHNNINLSINFNNELFKFNPTLDFSKTYSSPVMTNEEILNEFNTIRHLEEDEKGNILSFFTNNNSHIVTQLKELKQERPTGMIFIQNGFKKFKESPLSFTAYMYGVFASHIVMGNTDINYFSGEGKTHLNILKSQGMRIFVKINNEYKILTMPSIFVMGINSATWYYKINDDILTIITAISYDQNKIQIEVNSKKGIKYDILITNYVSMCNTVPVCKFNENKINFYFNDNTFTHSKYPNLHYSYKSINEPLLLEESMNNLPLLVHKINNSSNIKILISSNFEKEVDYIYEDIKTLNDNYYSRFKQSILNIQVQGNSFAEKINDLTSWYTLNALIHYSSPHGLEQCFGGAWGTRDVLQGPVELFLTFGKFDIVKDIILKVYSRQFVHNSDWPQWFMFDNYHSIQAGDSHGDIIVWPLKSVSDYIKSSQDVSILDKKIPFYDFNKGNFTNKKYTLFEHIIKQIQTIKNSFIQNTSLSCYGGGDWDDTLQPKDRQKAKFMVSGWTILLTLEALKNLIEVLKDTKYPINEFKKIYKDMLIDFKKYVIKDKIPSGFIYLNNDKIEYILHPLDSTSKINYRLLPLTRGMIGEIYNKNQVKQYLNIIEKNLLYPDGVRLISSPIKYNYGQNTMFMRAETASNFGREIGMQYVHAHIRYCEAMSKIGKNKKLVDGIKTIIPIKIKDKVQNANIRQSNVYFSSSDGDFLNRFDAIYNFDKLKTASVKVKAGWRLYSSGAGIFLRQVYQNLYGIKITKTHIQFDPVMTKELDKTTIKINLNNKQITIEYHIENNKSLIYLIKNNNQEYSKIEKNRYRNCGIKIPINNLKSKSKIEVFAK